MNNIRLFTDSSCDLPQEYLKEHSVTMLPFYVSFNSTDYYKEIEEISIDTFYETLVSTKVFPKTSLPSVQNYLDAFMPAVKEDANIICTCLTSKFSGSYQSACTAKDMILDDYPNANISIINSMQATAGQGLVLHQIIGMAEAGMSYIDILSKIDSLISTSRIFFTVGTLEYLQKGGRVGKASALAGSILNLKPIIQLNEGELLPIGTVRGRGRSLDKVVSLISEYFEQHGESYNDYDFCVVYGSDKADSLKVLNSLENLIGYKLKLPLMQIGITIGTYTGPDPCGICFVKKWINI
jgi:EDD domain protein, DegV family